MPRKLVTATKLKKGFGIGSWTMDEEECVLVRSLMPIHLPSYTTKNCYLELE